MIEKVLRDYLNSIEGMPPTYTEKPEFAPDVYIIIENTGTSVRNCVASSLIAVDTYADSLYNAAALNQAVVAALLDANLSEVSSINLNSAHNYTDVTTKTYCYEASFDVTHYEV